MKLSQSILIASVAVLSVVSVANSSLICSTDDITLLYQGYAQGQSSDSATTTSQCYQQATKVANYYSTIYQSLKGTSLSNYDNTLLNQLFSNIQNVMVQSSGMLESCQDLNKIKQLDIRLTTLSGFFQMMFTAGFSYFKQEAVYESVQGLKNLQSTDCTTVGKLYGQFLAAILQTKTVSQLNQAEVSTFGSGNGGASTIQTSDSSTTPGTP
eukprot:403341286